MSLLSFFNAPPFIDISSFPTFLEVHSLEISYEFKDIWLLWSWLKRTKIDDAEKRKRHKNNPKKNEKEWQERRHIFISWRMFLLLEIFFSSSQLFCLTSLWKGGQKTCHENDWKVYAKNREFFLSWFLPPSDLKRWKDDRKRKIRFHPKDNEWWLGSNAVRKAVERSKREGEGKDGKFFNNNVNTTRMTY